MVDVAKDLVRFNITDAAIAELKDRYMALKITDLASKEQYEAVHAGRMDCVKRRTNVTAVGKELRAEALDYNRKVIEEEKRIVSLLAPIEDHLTAEEQKVKDEKDRIKREADVKEAARIQFRVDRVCAFGATFDGQQYTVAGITLPHALLKVANDGQFEMFLGNIQKNVDAEKTRVAEEERRKKEEEDRLEADRVRLEDENRKLRIEQERIKAEQDAAAAKQLEEAKKLQGELDELRKERDRLEADKKAKEDEEKRKADGIERQKEIESAKKEAAAKALKDAEEKAKQDAEAKAAKELKDKLAAEKKEARRPDKKKLESFVETFAERNLLPEMKTDEGVVARLTIGAIIKQAKADIMAVVEEL